MSAIKRTVVALLVLAGTLANRAWAAEHDAPLLVSRGLRALHHNQLLEAHQLFDEAVAKGPALAAARYYRAMTAARLGDLNAAIIDLMVVLLMQPDWIEAELELGIVLVDAERPRDALPHLERAVTQEELRKPAELFIGVARWRLGEAKQAKIHLERARQDPELELTARYYLGHIAYNEEDWTSATEHFTAVKEGMSESEMATEAAEFLALMRGRSGRPYTLHASLGVAYDSNVPLAPSDQSEKDFLGVSDEADGRVEIGAGARYSPWRSPYGQLSLGYEFGQRLYFDLTSFDFQSHRPTIELSTKLKPLQLGILGRYDYYRLDNESFLQEPAVIPWLRIQEDPIGWTELSYRYRYSDYLEDRFAASLDADSHTIAVRQFFLVEKRLPIFWMGYLFERRDAAHTAGEQFAYDASQAEAGLSWGRLPVVDAGLDLAYRFRHENYDAASSGRDDDENGIALAVVKPLHEHIAVRLSYIGIFNNSNFNTFTYDRHVVSMQLEVSL